MHVDVNDILKQGEGAQASYAVEGEKPELEDVTLTAPISGSIRIVGTKTGVLMAGSLDTEVELECHRCLRTFSHHLRFPVEAEFSQTPGEEQFPIDKHGRIDLIEPIRQELVVHLPLQQLCQADCDGLQLKQKKDSNGSS